MLQSYSEIVSPFSLIQDHTSVSIYDPVFTPEDIELFRSLQFQILSVRSSYFHVSSYHYLPSSTIHFLTTTLERWIFATGFNHLLHATL